MKLAFNIIARDGVKDLQELIPQLNEVADEIVVVVDERSSDNTFEVAQQLGCKVFKFDWTDKGFCDARNFAIDNTLSPLICWTDCDDRYDNFDALKELKKSDDLKKIYTVKVRNWPKEPLFSQVRIFPNHPDVRFVYRIHETISIDCLSKGYTIQPLDQIVNHMGYANESLLKNKLMRNLPAMEQEVNSGSFCPSLKFTYAINMQSLKRFEESEKWLKEIVYDDKTRDSAFRDVWLFACVTLAKLLINQNRFSEAEYFISKGVGILPDFKDYWLTKAIIDIHHKDFMNGWQSLTNAIKCPRRDYAVAINYDELDQKIAALASQFPGGFKL